MFQEKEFIINISGLGMLDNARTTLLLCTTIILSIYSVYVTANLRNQIFPGFPNLFRESEESLKLIFSKSNLNEPNLG